MDIFEKYLPIFYKDTEEPFNIEAIACTEYTCPQKSVSSKFNIEFSDKTSKVLEYAIYWDFDIQHLYDLEHVFIYINKEEKVIDVISSFHGKFYRQSEVEFDGFHPVLFIQPGKHAIMAHPEYFNLFVDLYSSCKEKAGEDGILIPDFLESRIQKTEEEETFIISYIKRNFSFTPKMEFIKEEVNLSCLTTWNSLLEWIPSYMKTRIEIAKACEK